MPAHAHRPFDPTDPADIICDHFRIGAATFLMGRLVSLLSRDPGKEWGVMNRSVARQTAELFMIEWRKYAPDWEYRIGTVEEAERIVRGRAA